MVAKDELRSRQSALLEEIEMMSDEAQTFIYELVDHAERYSAEEFDKLLDRAEVLSRELEEVQSELLDAEDTIAELKESDFKEIGRVARLDALAEKIRELVHDVDFDLPSPYPLLPIRQHLRALGMNTQLKFD